MTTLPSGDRRTLAGQLATRDRSWDGWGMANWLPNPDPILKALGKDIATYRDLRADAHIGGCIRRRKAAVRTLEPVLERKGSSVRIHKAVEGILKDLWATPDPAEAGARPGLPALIAESLDGALYGYQPHEITWARAGALLVPQTVMGKPPEWFQFDGSNQLRFRARDRGIEGEVLPPRKFLLSRQDPTYQNPYGVADLAMCFWPGTFKRGGMKFWAKFVEKYGGAFIVGKLPRNNKTSDYTDLVDQLSAMIEDAVAAIPDDGSVEIMTSSGTQASTDAHLKFLLYCQGQIAMALLGTNQGTEQTSTVASAMAALEVADDIRDADARMTEATVNQLIRWIVDVNWPGAVAPCWELRAEERVDKTRPERDKILTEAGVRFSKAYWMRTYDLEEDDLVAAPEPPEPPEPGEPVEPAPGEAALRDSPADLAASIFGALEGAAAELRARGVSLPGWDGGQEVPDFDPALLERLGAQGQAAIRAMLDQVRTILASAQDMDEAAALLEAAYPELDAAPLAAALTDACLVAQLAGRADVIAEGQA